MMTVKFSYKLFRQGSDTLLAISDASIVGKTYEEGELRIAVSGDFYSGDTCGEKEGMKLIKGATIINAVGPEIISLLVRQKIVEKEKVLVVSGVPHAQIVVLRG